MQSKGTIRIVTLLIALACLWQLSFTVVTKIQEGKAVDYAQAAVAAEQENPEFLDIKEADRAFYLDSLSKEKNRYYLDSIASEKVYFSYTFKDVKEKEINLGLDLKGGMNVMLQVELRDLIKALSGHNTDPKFAEALTLTDQMFIDSRSDYITLFADAWTQVAPDVRLAQIFGTYEMRDKIFPESTDEEVISVIRTEAESAISNSFNVLRNRIDRFGVTSPNIQRLGNTGRILVELPGVKEPERVRKLLQGTASLEFWTTYDNSEIFADLQQANNLIKEIYTEEVEQVEAQTAAVAEGDLASEILAADSLTAGQEDFLKNNPLFAVLSPNMYNGQLMRGPSIGFAHYKDTAKINDYLSHPQVKDLFPVDFVPMWTVKPNVNINPNETIYELIAIKSTRDGKAPLDGGSVSDARMSFGNSGSLPEVNMTMNAEGARVWARLTADNIGKSIAIVLDGMVYSSPNVETEITGGSSRISGNFTIEEAEDLANVLKSGKLPAPATIVQEQVVGPSLGSESINSGMISFVLAFALVLVYMLLFYRGAGVAANVALLTNVLFLFGALSSFGAVLTLPGIAGLVLTLGMAVDANVIIYERIKEELRAGKALRLAVADGYKNAYSAIIDGQLTTVITGIILFIFGSGPVQGFATTLVIGIITSVFSSIFVTRLIFERKLNKNKNITFDSKVTRNFLQNTKIDFLAKRKKAYIFSAILIVVGLVSIFTKGFTLGVDFTGGRTYIVRFDNEVTAEDIREATIAEFGETVEVKQFGGASQMKITTKYMINDNSSEVDELVEQKVFNAVKDFYTVDITFDEFTSTLDNPNGIISSDKVGPTIANDIQRDAVVAVIIALFAIFAYIALRFKNWTWGLGGVTALIHNALITIGFFSIFSGLLPFSLDIDQTFIAAILTIIGYSINDNVVIFDRIRENKDLHPKRSFFENVNSAVNSTLARTINTSGTTLIVMLAIAIFGGEVIRGFAVALIVGIIFGTYSSIFIATPVMFDLSAKEESKKLKATAKK